MYAKIDHPTIVTGSNFFKTSNLFYALWLKIVANCYSL